MHKLFVSILSADAVNNAAGLGFTGYDGNGNPCWDLTENVDILGVEVRNFSFIFRCRKYFFKMLMSVQSLKCLLTDRTV